LIYKLHGMAQKADFQKYESYFLGTMESFKNPGMSFAPLLINPFKNNPHNQF
jgi:hypothetical protein